jgi:hypothetical protein
MEDFAVTVFRPRGRNTFYVFFRSPDGRQRNLSTGSNDYETAKRKAAEVVASELRRPAESAKEQTLREEIAILRHQLDEQAVLLRLLVAGGQKVSMKAVEEATKQFLTEKAPPEVSEAHYRDLERVCRLLEAWASKQGVKTVADLTTKEIEAWLLAGKWGARTFNARLNTAAIFLHWCVKKQYVMECAAAPISRKRCAKCGRPQTLTLDQSKKLMEYVEGKYPEYCAFFALALFGGVRSSTGKGGSELRRLLEQVQSEGWEKLSGGEGYIWVEKPKTEKGASGGARRAYVSPNCQAWLEKHPQALVPGVKAFQEIRIAIGIPKNAIRHTAVTAYVTHTQQIATATLLFGHDELTLRKYYLGHCSRQDAAAFYQIVPRPGAAENAKQTAA